MDVPYTAPNLFIVVDSLVTVSGFQFCDVISTFYK